MQKVNILLSTYNGELYIEQQLESLFNQTHSNFIITIRDDGSTDNTLSIVHQFMEKYPHKIQLLANENIGAKHSFISLLQYAEISCDYFAFCDQDDIWLPTKLEQAIYILKDSESVPSMTCSTTTLVNNELDVLTSWPKAPRKAPSFLNAIVENIAVGATIVFNKSALLLINQYPPDADKIIMHDWWAYLTISAFGKITFIESPTMLYRQHQNNVIGGELSFKHKLQKKLKSYKKNKHKRLLHQQANHFQALFGEQLESTYKKQLLLFLKSRNTWLNKVSFLGQTKVYRQNKLDHLLFKFLVMIGYI